MKLMVYSHDAFGLGNIRRMLAICEYLLQTIPGLSILVLSGSPALHSLRLPAGLDYIKLPCLSRDRAGEMGVTFLDTSLEETVNLRAELILSAIQHFRPDVFLVDKKPSGLLQELQPTLKYLEQCAQSPAHPSTQLVLLLRDILDAPEVTQSQWERHGYFEMLERLYAQIWIVGSPDIFDAPQAYGFPEAIAQKVRFCGYIRRNPGERPRPVMRQEMGLTPADRLVLVTPGGGADGDRLVITYLDLLASDHSLAQDPALKSLIVCGYEMPLAQRQMVHRAAAANPQVEVLDFSDDLISLMDAADLVVSMGGYNTVCEILSLRKRAIVVPRLHPVQEQWMRAERMAQRQLFTALHPDHLSPSTLAAAMQHQLQGDLPPMAIDLDALPRIAQMTAALLPGAVKPFAVPSSCFLPTSPCLAIANP
ncbi:MAG: glycosyltransferase [Synechococcales bacterium]|nr:glycosyltransferase [Synechococcales bacterium]